MPMRIRTPKKCPALRWDNARLGKAFAQGTERGQGHDGVADPVSGADEDALVVGQVLLGLH